MFWVTSNTGVGEILDGPELGGPEVSVHGPAEILGEPLHF
jgi:hypothetical protein